MRLLSLLIFLSFASYSFAQQLEVELQRLEGQLDQLKTEQANVETAIEGVKLQRIQRDLQKKGLPKLMPGEELIQHEAMCLVYSEEHEQAKWVAHIITSDIIEGSVFRTNDFRPDPLVKTGTAVEKDYFLKYLQSDNSYEYDGFGYDRGHLAPSADFRWSEKALSESYFYSNMSPQLPEFNREIWADLENKLRSYIYRYPGTELYVVTGPVLEDGLPKIERSINKVSIPKQFWKVAIDLKNQKGIGFLLPHEGTNAPLETFAMSIDRVEAATGIDFFANLPDNIEPILELQLDKSAWLPELQSGNVEPIQATSLPKNHFNTTQAKIYMDSDDKINVCGTAVSTPP